MTVKPVSIKQIPAKKRIWSRRKSLMQYPGGVPRPSTFGHTSRLIAEELNDLSYLVRKYPKEAMKYLNGKEMFEECMARRLFNHLEEDSDCGERINT